MPMPEVFITIPHDLFFPLPNIEQPSSRVRLLGQRKFKVDICARQSLVDFLISVESVVDALSLLFVENNLEQLAAILALKHATSNNFDWINEIGHDGLVNSLECTRTRALLRLVGAAAIAALGARENAARSNNEDVSLGEFLLEFTGEALLNLVPGREQRNRHENDNGLASRTDINLASGNELQWPQRAAHVGDVGLQVVDCRGNAELSVRRGRPRRAVGCNLVESWV